MGPVPSFMCSASSAVALVARTVSTGGVTALAGVKVFTTFPKSTQAVMVEK